MNNRSTTPPPKTCRACGRGIEWRKKWERDWENVKYCSKGCRSRRINGIDRELEAEILKLLDSRGRGKTICPSEVARSVGAANDLADDGWRDLMEPTRAAARRLVAQELVDITQGGSVVDPSTAKGPIRIRKRR